MITLAYPLRFDQGRRVATVLVDSPEHVAQCVEAAVRTEEGWRLESPEFGIPPLTLQSGAVDLDELRAAIVRSEPRASAAVERVEDVDDLRAERLRILIDEVS